MYDARSAYRGPYVENAPDLLVGFAPGYRTSWESVTGGFNGEVIADNPKRWAGDHSVDPEFVRGVLFCNRKVEQDDPAIIDIAPTALAALGVEPPAHMDGTKLTFAASTTDALAQTAGEP